jgi:hypothetical protein
MLTIGLQYNVRVKNVILPYDGASETSDYTGFVLPSAKYDPPETVRLSTGIRDFPIRVIQKDRIVAIGDQAVRFVPRSQTNNVRLVQGSNGTIYTVTTQNGRSICTCTGFQFRKSCKHTAEVV